MSRISLEQPEPRQRDQRGPPRERRAGRAHLARDERRAVEIIGKTGTGKSTLLYNLMRTDYAARRGFAFLDPHGDQAMAIADAAPRRRTNDVIYLDAADLSYSIAWNPLERVERDRRAVVAAQIATAFSGIWGLSASETPRLLYILDKALRLLLDNPAEAAAGHIAGATLLDLPQLRRATDASGAGRVPADGDHGHEARGVDRAFKRTSNARVVVESARGSVAQEAARNRSGAAIPDHVRFPQQRRIGAQPPRHGSMLAPVLLDRRLRRNLRIAAG